MILPRSFVLAAWANAWLAGEVSLDEVCDAVRASGGVDATGARLGMWDGLGWDGRAGSEPYADGQLDAHAEASEIGIGIAHHVHAADAHALMVLDSTDAEPLMMALSRLRRAGTTRFGVALPVPGDPLGLAGPRVFTEQAVEAGEAVVCDGAGIGLIPHVVGAGVQWAAGTAEAAWGQDLAEADGRLAQALSSAVRVPAGDAGKAGAELAARIRSAGATRQELLPPCMSRRAAKLTARIGTCLALLEYGTAELPGAATVPPDVWRELSAAARRGLVAVADTCRAGRTSEL